MKKRYFDVRTLTKYEYAKESFKKETKIQSRIFV